MTVNISTPRMTNSSILRHPPQIPGPVIGLAVGCTAGALLLLLGVCLLLRLYRKKQAKSLSYEQMGSEYHSITQLEAAGLAPVRMKQIPFTVPSTGISTTARRSDSRFLDETSTGSGSEPASPTALKRPSVEIPGAYALGSIDPSLYKICDEDDDYDVPEDHIGRVWFAVEYERESEKLLVTLIKSKNLPNRSFGNVNSCDPFVRIYLMPDERRYLQSKFRKKTCNPKFEESYVFQVSYKAIQDRILKLTVFDVDRHKRHNVIGHALYPLREHDCEINERVVVWRDLEREVSETTSDRGEILISICYNNHMERLTVGVFEGRAYKKPESCSSVDSYMKVSLLLQNKVIKTKKTEVIKKTSEPSFNESFTFKLQASSLDTASINVSALQHVSGHKDKSIGRVVLGSFMFARGKELEHWNEMVANPREQITQWHVLT